LSGVLAVVGTNDGSLKNESPCFLPLEQPYNAQFSPAQEKSSSLQRIFKSKIDNSAKLFGTSSDG
jgi:hypothetical protein